MKKEAKSRFLLFVALMFVLISDTGGAQEISRQYRLREVGKIDASGTSLPKELNQLDKGKGGVIGIYFGCDPSALQGRVTPSVVLLAVPEKVTIGQEFSIEIAIINLCDTAIDLPISTTFVKPETSDPQYISIMKLELATEDERFEFDGQEFLFGATDQPATVQRLMRNEYLRVKMKVRAKLTESMKAVDLRQPEFVTVMPYLKFWERNSDRAKGGIWGPLSAGTTGGSDKTIAIEASGASNK